MRGQGRQGPQMSSCGSGGGDGAERPGKGAWPAGSGTAAARKALQASHSPPSPRACRRARPSPQSACVLTARGQSGRGQLKSPDRSCPVLPAQDTIVLSSGKNVEPQPLEDAVASCPLIKHVVVLGQVRGGRGCAAPQEVRGSGSDPGHCCGADVPVTWGTAASVDECYSLRTSAALTSRPGAAGQRGRVAPSERRGAKALRCIAAVAGQARAGRAGVAGRGGAGGGARGEPLARGAGGAAGGRGGQVRGGLRGLPAGARRGWARWAELGRSRLWRRRAVRGAHALRLTPRDVPCRRAGSTPLVPTTTPSTTSRTSAWCARR